jgi:hypothetical protein
MTTIFLQIKDVSGHSFDNSAVEIIEPIAALVATALVVLITFYLSNLKHDMLDEWNADKHHRMRKKSPYARLMKYFFKREVFRMYL